MKRRSLLVLMTLAGWCAAWGQKKPVTLEAAAATRPRLAEIASADWSPDGNQFLYTEARKLRVYDCVARQSRVLATFGELEAKAKGTGVALEPEWRNRRVAEPSPQWAPDGKSVMVSAGGDVFFIDAASGEVRQLTATAFAEEDARLSPDGVSVGYRFANDLYIIPAAGGKARRVTFDGAATRWNGKLDWVYPEELDISRAWWWSPTSKELAYLQFDVSAEMVYPHVDNGPLRAITEPQRYPKAGTPNANVRLGVVSRQGGPTRWMVAERGAEGLLARVQWMPGGREIAVQRLNREQNHLELLAVSATTGKKRLLLEERDPAWVNLHHILHFFRDGRFLWASERDGFRHLYLYGESAPRQLTSGNWEVVELNGVDVERGLAFVTTTRESVLERHLYRVDLATGALRKQTSEPGTHSISMAPNAAYYLDTAQSLQNPPRRNLIDREGTVVATIEEAAPPEFDLLPVETVSFSGKDGTKFYGQLIKPKGFDPAVRYPAIVFVYGGPHAQTVRDTWAGPNWEQALAHRGYVVWRMDNRGSNYRGHAFEKVVHRQFGRMELADQSEGVDYLVNLGFVDPGRLGIYGWSFGGYMTLYSMTRTDRFAAGIAGAPVTDWRLYDTIYTERYMGMPGRNESGYADSSPVHKAGDLSGALMLVHNFQDDNVLFQNSFQMAAALQKAGKLFDTMFYPLKAHAVTGPLRLHLLRTLTAFFDRHLSSTER